MWLEAKHVMVMVGWLISDERRCGNGRRRRLLHVVVMVNVADEVCGDG